MPKGVTSSSVCPKCAKAISLFAFARHSRVCAGPKIRKKRIAWNKGLSSETDPRVENNGRAIRQALKENPRLGVSPSEGTREKISDAMKIAHAEGRAWNIGKSRWNNQPSWPEQFFMEVIANEFDDKVYEREFPFERFSLDFAWPAKKKCIEIDGDQHRRFEEYRLRDARKDQLLKQFGWEVLRIAWKDFYGDTKGWISKANNFIGM